jgi:hypothetical protein
VQGELGMLVLLASRHEFYGRSDASFLDAASSRPAIAWRVPSWPVPVMPVRCFELPGAQVQEITGIPSPQVIQWVKCCCEEHLLGARHRPWEG